MKTENQNILTREELINFLVQFPESIEIGYSIMIKGKRYSTVDIERFLIYGEKLTEIK